MRKFDSKTLLVATHNQGKLEEIADLLSDLGIEVVGASAYGLPEPRETGTTFAENARIKAHAAAKAANMPALADDSGLEVDALDGAPGVYTADWAETPQGRDFTLAMTKTHDLLEARGAKLPTPGRFKCTFALAWPDGDDAIFEGHAEGHIVWPMRGTQGHGYDPIFVPLGEDRTFAEIDRWTKNRMSHRMDAFRKLRAALGE